MNFLIDMYMQVSDVVDLYSVPIIAGLQAMFCGGCAYQIAFRYRRGDSSYHWIPSLCAFGLASLLAQQWLSIVSRVLMYGTWPIVSLYNTLVFGILFVLLARAKGNVARMFDFSDQKNGEK